MQAPPTRRPRGNDGVRAAGPRRAPALLGRRPLAALALATALPVVALLAPCATLAVGTRRAAACLASVEAPRGPALPDCRAELRWISPSSWLPWARAAAARRAEELGARAAVAAYVDAAVGAPDHAALARAIDGVDGARAAVDAGSRRTTFDELGPARGAPRPGREAARLGDRRALLAQPDRFPEWDARVHALRAALTEGDLPRAIAIARGYAGMDPRDEDLRTTVGALLCLGERDDAKRGLDLLTSTQDDRASRRYAAMARDFGEVRAVLVACAARAGVAPPPEPVDPAAGEADAVEARAAQRVRLAASSGAADAVDEKRRAVRAAGDLLGSARLDPRARAGLLAVVLAEDDGLDAPRAAALAEEGLGRSAPPGRQGAAARGAPLAARGATAWGISPLAGDWHPEHGLLRPVVAGSLFARAASRAVELAGGGELSRSEGDALRAAAGALALRAARELAVAGDAPGAIEVLDRLGALAPEPAPQALVRSSVWYLAGEHHRSLALLDGVDGAAAPPALRAAVLLQRAELLAALGRSADAARAAVLADEAAAAAAPAGLTDDPAAAAPHAGPAVTPDLALLEARARWTRLALARAAGTSPLRPGAPPAARPPGAAGWPWVGFARLDAPWARPDQPAFSTALAWFSAARDAPPPERRALRYAALRRRGDAPPALVPYAVAAAQLLGEGEGDAEVWLDAFLALDAGRFSLRHYTFARAEAARWRGDTASAAAWQRRHEALRAVAADPSRAEIARCLGL